MADNYRITVRKFFRPKVSVLFSFRQERYEPFRLLDNVGGEGDGSAHGNPVDSGLNEGKHVVGLIPPTATWAISIFLPAI